MQVQDDQRHHQRYFGPSVLVLVWPSSAQEVRHSASSSGMHVSATIEAEMIHAPNVTPSRHSGSSPEAVHSSACPGVKPSSRDEWLTMSSSPISSRRVSSRL